MVASLRDGVVEIQLNGKTVELKATPDAAIRLSRLYQGISPIMGKLQALDVDAFANVIRYGANLQKKEELDALSDDVWNTGLTNLLVDLLEYIGILANGGKRFSDDGEAGSAAKGK